MSKQLYANNAKTTLAASIGQSDTSIQVASAAGFPTPTNGQYFAVTIDSGTAVEVIYVYGTSGNTFTGCLRGQEGTIAQNFQPGTRIECRVTAQTLASFARYQDRLANIASVDSLNPPAKSDGNSYVTASTDDAGNPIVAIENGATWRFVGYPTVALNGTAQAGSTTTKLAFANAAGSVQQPFAGKYIIQFTTGANQGLARAVTSSDATGVTWATALPNPISVGDGFEVYQSAASSINSLIQSADQGLIFAILFSD